MTSKIIVAGFVALLFVAGSFMTNSVYAQVDPIQQLQMAVIQLRDAVIQNAQNIEGEIGARLLNDQNQQAQIDSFFDVFTEITVHNDDVDRLDGHVTVLKNQADGFDTEMVALSLRSDQGDVDLQTQIDAIEPIPGPPGPPGMDTHEELRDPSIVTYNARPCTQLPASIEPVSYLVNQNVGVLTEIDFEELPYDLPFYAYASIGEPGLAEVILFAGNFAPRNWAYADGTLMDISQNTALFSLLGTQYGGDGRTTFSLPDMRCLEADDGPRYIIALQGIFPSRN
jgi:hypothetical protein